MVAAAFVGYAASTWRVALAERTAAALADGADGLDGADGVDRGGTPPGPGAS